jgi:hypothetical protein
MRMQAGQPSRLLITRLRTWTDKTLKPFAGCVGKEV